MKGKSRLIILLLIAIIGGLTALLYFGIGENKILGINNIKQGLDLRGGVSIVYEADKAVPTAEEMSSAVALMRGRLDRKNHTDADVASENTNRIRVDIPGVEDAEQAVIDIGKTAQLNFVDEEGNILVSGALVANARKEMQTGQAGGSEVVVVLEFNDEGQTLFEEATGNNVGKRILIMLDEEVISAPNVNAKITGGNAVISGGFTAESAEELSSLIRAGSLPFKLDVVYMNNVGAKLGAEALSTSIIAGIIGSILVLLFMLIIYKTLGIAADIALLLYITIELVLLSLLGVTLTLPGIAGIILSIGMAVDANVIIFERIKEELRLGRTLRAAVDSGFKRAFPAILDGNVTTLIASVILFLFGTGPIKGFAQTLTIGVILSMFTALIITKTILKSFLGMGINNPKAYYSK